MKHILVTACLVLALTGCAGDDDESTPAPPLDTPTSAAPTVQPDSPGGTLTELPPAAPSEVATG